MWDFFVYNLSMTNNSFGNILKQLRLENGISQRQLGNHLNMSNQTVSFWEIGKREPDLDTLVKIADFFDVSVDYLLDRE